MIYFPYFIPSLSTLNVLAFFFVSCSLSFIIFLSRCCQFLWYYLSFFVYCSFIPCSFSLIILELFSFFKLSFYICNNYFLVVWRIFIKYRCFFPNLLNSKWFLSNLWYFLSSLFFLPLKFFFLLGIDWMIEGTFLVS
jgi:hypothetical protein